MCMFAMIFPWFLVLNTIRAKGVWEFGSLSLSNRSVFFLILNCFLLFIYIKSVKQKVNLCAVKICRKTWKRVGMGKRKISWYELFWLKLVMSIMLYNHYRVLVWVFSFEPYKNRIITFTFCLEKITGFLWPVIIFKLLHFLFVSANLWPHQCRNIVSGYAITSVL